MIYKNLSVIGFKSNYQAQVKDNNQKEKKAVILGSSKTPEEIRENLSALGKKPEYIEKTVTNYNTMLTKAHDLGKRLAEKGYKVLTGAGPGIMKSANEGAHEVEEKSGTTLSYGVDTTELSNSWRKNMPFKFVDAHPKKLSERTEYFGDQASIVFAFPGGPGTQEEVSVLQERTMYLDPAKQPKLVFMDREYFAPQEQWHKKMENMGLISPNSNKNLHTYADSVNEAMQIVDEAEKTMKLKQVNTL